MEYLDNLLEKKNMPQLVLVVLFIIYLVIGFKMPDPVANLIDSSPGKIVIALVALLMFAYSNPVLGVLSLLVAYHMISTASIKTGMAALEEYYPTEAKKWTPFSPTNQFPYTLEQEMVKKMTPQKFNTNYVKASYKPMLEDTYDASTV
jgi:hypothetical protein